MPVRANWPAEGEHRMARVGMRSGIARSGGAGRTVRLRLPSRGRPRKEHEEGQPFPMCSWFHHKSECRSPIVWGAAFAIRQPEASAV